MDQAVSLDYYYWATTTMKPSKLQVICLISLYYVNLNFLLTLYMSLMPVKLILIHSFYQQGIALAKK